MPTPRIFVALLLALPCSTTLATVVFFTDFESGLPSELAAPGASVQGTQGYGGLSNATNPANTFGNNFLRYDSTTIQPTTLTLTGLPAHNAVTIEMLLGVIDSWDDTELLEIRLDGQLLFSHQWQLATGDSSSYMPPPGGLLSSGTNLGFNGGGFHSRDRAYDLSIDPVFANIPHSSSSLTLEFIIGSATAGSAAENWQGGDDESWAIDNLSVSVIPEPSSLLLLLAATASLVIRRRVK